MRSIEDRILLLAKQLYPTGRAFKMPHGGFFSALHEALAISKSTAYTDALSTFDSIIPDNDNFTADDATDWERRLGLITADGVALSDRKLAIIRKMQFPGQAQARGNYLFVQGQLQSAGFNVYVYENRFPDGMGGYITQNPVTLSGVINYNQHGQFQHGQKRHGGSYRNICVNHIDEKLDWNFNIGDSLRSTFFIGGSPLGTFATVPFARKDEFRQLILKLKPAQTVAFLFINYI